MIESVRFIWQNLLLSVALLLAGILLLPHIPFHLPLAIYIITLLAVTAINLVAFLIMGKGVRKRDQGGMVFILAGIGVKFLLYLLYILVFWLVTKNLDKAFILIFFALYLVFTIFLAIRLLKLLKDK